MDVSQFMQNVEYNKSKDSVKYTWSFINKITKVKMEDDKNNDDIHNELNCAQKMITIQTYLKNISETWDKNLVTI